MMCMSAQLFPVLPTSSTTCNFSAIVSRCSSTRHPVSFNRMKPLRRFQLHLLFRRFPGCGSPFTWSCSPASFSSFTRRGTFISKLSTTLTTLVTKNGWQRGGTTMYTNTFSAIVSRCSSTRHPVSFNRMKSHYDAFNLTYFSGVSLDVVHHLHGHSLKALDHTDHPNYEEWVANGGHEGV